MRTRPLSVAGIDLRAPALQRAGGRIIADVAATAAQERIVLQARDSLADPEFRGDHNFTPPALAS